MCHLKAVTKTNFNFVHPSGFEPETDGLENRCSIQLSYGCFYLVFTDANIKKIAIYIDHREILK